MSWYPSDAWRDSYDSWKLATPPEYEWDDGEEEQRWLDEQEAEEERQRAQELCECNFGCRPASAFRAEPICDEVPF